MLRDILNYSGLSFGHGTPPNFFLISTHDPAVKKNVAAKVCPDGQRYIFFDPEFVAELRDDSPKDWAVYGVFAHEVGHHLLYHELGGKGDIREMELDAYRFSGYTLARLGATVKHALACTDRAAPYATDTHPGRCQERVAIIEGYNKARRQMHKQTYEIANECDPIMPVPVAQQPLSQAAAPEAAEVTPNPTRVHPPAWPKNLVEDWWAEAQQALRGPDGEAYFDSNLRNKTLPTIQAWVQYLGGDGQVCVRIGEFRLGQISCDIWFKYPPTLQLQRNYLIEFRGTAYKFSHSELSPGNISLYLQVRPEDIRVIRR
jgi:hypothetical protein